MEEISAFRGDAIVAAFIVSVGLLLFVSQSIVEHQMSRDRLENSVNGLALPAEAAQDQRVFPGGTGKFARRSVATIDCLQPFLHLLPDMSDVDVKEQNRLYQTIYSAGVSAALTLHKYLYESADGGKGASPATVADRLSRVELNALDLKEVSHCFARF